jgi:hypothetical protein
MVLEVNDSAAVPWTKPDDLDVDAAGLEGELFGPTGQTHAAFFDGSVRRLHIGMDAKTLRAFFTRAAGDVSTPTVGDPRLAPQPVPDREAPQRVPVEVAPPAEIPASELPSAEVPAKEVPTKE